MDTKVRHALKFSKPSDREFAMTRDFDAPRRLVFEAMTKPEHVKRWLGCAELTVTDCEIDLCVGGAYRYTMRTSSGGVSTLRGRYLEIMRPERIVFTEQFEMPGFISPEYQVTSTYAESGGVTTLTTTIRHANSQDRDGHFNSGIENGVGPAYDRLAEIVAEMA